MEERQDRKAAPERGGLSRRSFMKSFWLLAGGVALAEAVTVAIDFLKPHGSGNRTKEAGIYAAGPVEGFQRGTVTAFPAGKFYLARLDDGGFLALSRFCTHLGCTLPWNAGEKRFVCTCHASAFTITGEVSSPPAPRPLDYYPVRIENGFVKVDLSKPLRRRTFETGQATYT